MLRSFVREEAGASLLEYGLLVALIAVVSIVAIRTLGTRIREVFLDVVAELNNAGVLSFGISCRPWADGADGGLRAPVLHLPFRR